MQEYKYLESLISADGIIIRINQAKRAFNNKKKICTFGSKDMSTEKINKDIFVKCEFLGSILSGFNASHLFEQT